MIAIITARGGSKRIPKKNIKDFLGKPIIAYSIEAAKKSGLFEAVMVSTDSEEIKNVALQYGAEVPFMRSEATSNDFATTKDVLVEVINEYKKMGKVFDEFACIYPTAPLITGEILKDSYHLFKEKNASSLIPVVRFSFPPQRGLICSEDSIRPWDKDSIKKRSQDLDAIYHDVGAFYYFKTEDFLNSLEIITDKTVPYIMNAMHVQDIDSMDDWEIAEHKYKFINRKTWL